MCGNYRRFPYWGFPNWGFPIQSFPLEKTRVGVVPVMLLTKIGMYL
jgi:hypothetical protein